MSEKKSDSLFLIKLLSPLAIPLAFKCAFPDKNLPHRENCETILLLIFFTFMKIKYLWDDVTIAGIIDLHPDLKAFISSSLIGGISLFAAVQIGNVECFCALMWGVLLASMLGLHFLLVDVGKKLEAGDKQAKMKSLKCAIGCWGALNFIEIVILAATYDLSVICQHNCNCWIPLLAAILLLLSIVDVFVTDCILKPGQCEA